MRNLYIKIGNVKTKKTILLTIEGFELETLIAPLINNDKSETLG